VTLCRGYLSLQPSRPSGELFPDFISPPPFSLSHTHEAPNLGLRRRRFSVVEAVFWMPTFQASLILISLLVGMFPLSVYRVVWTNWKKTEILKGRDHLRFLGVDGMVFVV
jgi:hypothetical protein